MTAADQRPVVGRSPRWPVRLGYATLTVAAAGLVSAAMLNASFTERWGLTDPTEAAALLVAAPVLSLAGVGLYALLWLAMCRPVRQSRSAAAALGGALFAFPALVARSGGGLFALAPVGIVAGLVWQVLVRRPWRPGERTAFLLLLIGAVSTLVRPAQTWWREHGSTPDEVATAALLGGAVHDGAAWLFDANGRLVSWPLAGGPVRTAARHGVAAVRADGGSLWVLLVPDQVNATHQPAGTFTVARHDQTGWHQVARRGYSVDQRPFGLVIANGWPLVIGPKRLDWFGPGGSQMLRLAPVQPVLWGGGAMALEDAHTLLIGEDHGEFGGVLRRIELPSPGAAVTAPLSVTNLCFIFPDDECQPVSAILPEPGRPGCVWVATSLIHFSIARGGVRELCGTHARLAWSRRWVPLGERIGRFFMPGSYRYELNQMPVSGLAPAADGFWAATPRGLFHVHAGGETRIDLLRPTPKNGLALARVGPALLVAWTGAARRHSVSGPVPLVFAAPEPPAPTPNGSH